MPQYPFTLPCNTPALAGKMAGRAIPAGEFGRYRVYPVHTRFDAVQWFATDADRLDSAGLPAVVRQCRTFADAVAGLNQGAR